MSSLPHNIYIWNNGSSYAWRCVWCWHSINKWLLVSPLFKQTRQNKTRSIFYNSNHNFEWMLANLPEQWFCRNQKKILQLFNIYHWYSGVSVIFKVELTHFINQDQLACRHQLNNMFCGSGVLSGLRMSVWAWRPQIKRNCKKDVGLHDAWMVCWEYAFVCETEWCWVL